MNFSQLVKAAGSGIAKHSPAILIGLGIVGGISAVVTAVSVTPKALKLIEQKKEETGKEKLTPIEVVKTTWKCYIAPLAIEAVSIACILGASRINYKRNVALAAAYGLTEARFAEYQKKVKDMVGEKKEETIRDEVAKDVIAANPVNDKQIVMTGKGEMLCYDAVSGRYFLSDIEKIRRARDILNVKLRSEMYISLNEFYSEIGLPHIQIGDDLGWNIDMGYIDISFSTQLSDDERPCLVLNYLVGPRYDYRNLH